jgi:LmbE family N-acetylglucosaminyl deacetylase
VRRLLFIGAHPDDETFLFGGTLAKYAHEGAHVCAICATRGERGKTGDLCHREDLARLRQEEMYRACQALGISDVRFLSYVDRELNTAPAEQIRRELVLAIRDVKPQLVLTFDPNGMNFHPDHLAISRFVSDAIAAAGDPRYFGEVPSHKVERLLWPAPVLAYKQAETPALASHWGVDFLIDTGPWWRNKEAAIRAHATQLPGLRKLFFDGGNTERVLSLEALRMGFGPPTSVAPSADLFEGICRR